MIFKMFSLFFKFCKKLQFEHLDAIFNKWNGYRPINLQIKNYIEGLIKKIQKIIKIKISV